MAVTHGMDVAAVEQLGHSLQRRKAEQIRVVVVDIDRSIRASHAFWQGPKGDLFRSWWPAKRSRMLAMAEDLAGFGQSALNNANEQRQASGAGGGGSAGGRSRPRTTAGSRGERYLGIAGLGQLVLDLDEFDKALNGLPLLGLAVPHAFGRVVGGSDEIGRFAKIGNLRARVVANQILGRPISPQLSGSLGGHTRAAFRWLESTPKPRVSGAAVFSGIVGVIDTGMKANQYGSGDAATMEAGTKAFLSTGATIAAGPVGGLVADAGFEAGKSIHAGMDAVFHTTDHAFDGHLMRTYGTTELTPAQAREVTQRYDGPVGIWNANLDAIRSTPTAVSGAAKRGWNTVKSFF